MGDVDAMHFEISLVAVPLWQLCPSRMLCDSANFPFGKSIFSFGMFVNLVAFKSE